VHRREQRTTKHTSNSKHMEGVHQDVVLSLEHKHVVERTRDTQRHRIREGTLTKRIHQEHSSSSSNRCRVSNHNPGAHPQTIGEFPLTTHVAEDANEEVEDYQLERPTVVEPLIQRGSFPDGIEVKSNRVGRRNDSTRDDVVSIHKRTSDWFTDTIDVHGRSSDKCNDEANCCGKQSRNHQNAKPTHIEAVVGAGDPVAELIPGIQLSLLSNSSSHLFV